MKLATFTHDGETRIGVVRGAKMLDLAAARPDLPRDMTAFLELGDEGMKAARDLEAAASDALPLGDVMLGPVVPRPPKFLAVGLNYADHIAETGRKAPDFPHHLQQADLVRQRTLFRGTPAPRLCGSGLRG